MKKKPYILLKWGHIKGGDFTNNKEAMDLWCNHDIEPSKEKDISVINLFNGDFYLWWEDRQCTKQEAIDYILNYQSQVQ